MLMCKINWEERVFEMAKYLYISGEYSMEGAINDAFEFKEIYLTAMKQLGESEEETPKSKEEKTKVTKDDENDDFVEKIYLLYPTKCPKRGTSLGKSAKDKNRIKKLLKTYTKEQIEAVVRKEIGDKFGISYMQNFSTFLNNFPDPSIMEGHIKEHTKKEQDFIINGVRYK